MRLAWFLAIRFLREGRTQTLLLVAGASVGVLLVVFLTALIGGLQRDLIDKTLGTQPHVVLRVPDEVATPLYVRRGGALFASHIERPAQRLRTVADWPRALATVAREPGVSAVAPLVTGPALATRGGVNDAVAVYGVEPKSFLGVYDVDRHLVAGRFDVTGDRVVIGRELADDLGLSVGDKLRISSGPTREQLVTLYGVFDLGVRDVNKRWVIVSVRAAQTLLDLPGGISQLHVRLSNPFAAPELAEALASRTGLTAEAWTSTNAQLLSGLKAQSASSQTIQLFVLIGVAVAIASVLVISVVQKQRQIGILRAMGMPRVLVQRVFLIEGGLVGLAGWLFGSLLGAGLVLWFSKKSSVQFPITLDASLFVLAGALAVGTGVVAALLPARRAAGLLPAVAIRNE